MALSEGHTASSLVKYVEANTMPLVGELNADSWKMYSTGSLPLFTIYLNPSRPLSKLVMKSVRDLAKAMVGEITFTFADTSKEGKGRFVRLSRRCEMPHIPYTMGSGARLSWAGRCLALLWCGCIRANVQRKSAEAGDASEE